MKSISVRELRSAIPRLRETLADERELLLVSHGEPVARILPVDADVTQAAVRPSLPSLKAFRDQQPQFAVCLTDLIREERDRR